MSVVIEYFGGRSHALIKTIGLFSNRFMMDARSDSTQHKITN